jgi:hypothetical protein
MFIPRQPYLQRRMPLHSMTYLSSIMSTALELKDMAYPIEDHFRQTLTQVLVTTFEIMHLRVFDCHGGENELKACIRSSF